MRNRPLFIEFPTNFIHIYFINSISDRSFENTFWFAIWKNIIIFKMRMNTIIIYIIYYVNGPFSIHVKKSQRWMRYPKKSFWTGFGLLVLKFRLNTYLIKNCSLLKIKWKKYQQITSKIAVGNPRSGPQVINIGHI